VSGALRLDGVSFTYPAFPRGIGWLVGRARPSVTPFTGLTFSVARGERVCLMGPNGSGKSTLLRLILGYLPPSAGTSRVLGQDSREGSARRLVGMVHPDERSFYWRLTVRENLAFFGALWGLAPRDAARRAAEAAETVELTPWLDRPFSDLSTGTRQRTAIARALLHDPPVLLMDEPTRSLDPLSSAHFREWLLGPACAGKTLLVATHNPEEARLLAGRCLVLGRGCLLLDGPPPSDADLPALMGGAA
jgi:ABC-type multidrug transport system ATPase subunit